MVKTSRKKEKKIRVEKEEIERRGRKESSKEHEKTQLWHFLRKKRKGVYISINFRSKDSDFSVKTYFEQILKII